MPTPLLSRGELLERLTETFRRYGYEGASMTLIAQATGLGKASLYHYFPNGKEQMAVAVLDHINSWFENAIFNPLESAHPPRQRITSMLAAIADHYGNGQAACLPGLLALTEDRNMFGETIAQFFARWVACLAQTLTDSGLARDIALRRAQDAVERIQGSLILSRAFADTRPFQAMVAELPDQLLTGADRSTVWTARARPVFPANPHATPPRPS